MKVNNNYEVNICVIDMTDGIPGDVYTDFTDYMKEIGGSYEFGFLIIDSATGLCPDWAQDWYSSIEEAMHDIALSQGQN